MASTEWRLIQVDEHGDVETIDTDPRAAEMIKQMERWTPDAGCLLTVEGTRDYDDGVRAFRRTGEVKGAEDHPHRATWATKDNEWYESGDEPDFERRSA